MTDQALTTTAAPFVPPMRLRLPAEVSEAFNISPVQWKALTEAVWPNATSIDSVVMALSYCQARKLDPFKKPVHIVPVWSKAEGKMVDTVWPGISELRTTAMRTGTYAGKSKTVFGPIIEQELSGVSVVFPEWAQVTLYRVIAGAGVCAFEGPEVHWLESYAKASRDTQAPNEMWRKRPRGQIDKCAEAAALRTAFPEELGGEYAAEEVEGQAFSNVRDVTPRRAAPSLADRLMSPTEGPTAEGFTAHNGLNGAVEDKDAPTFDQEQVEAGVAADDDFPGDRP